MIFRDLSFFNLVQRVLPEEIRFFTRKAHNKYFFRRKNVKISQNLKILPQDEKVVPKKLRITFLPHRDFERFAFDCESVEKTMYFVFFQ